jgi:excisionase family DNA binding protein
MAAYIDVRFVYAASMDLAAPVKRCKSMLNKPEPKPGSLKYAAARLGCSIPTVYQLIAEGRLRSYHFGRAHRVAEDAIRDCIELLEREERRARQVTSPTTNKQVE